MDEWQPHTVGSLCDAGLVELQTGPFGSQLHAYDYASDGIAVVPTEAIRNRRIDHSVLPKILPSKAHELARHRLRTGDILFARRGVQATGHIGLVRDAEDGFICGTGAIRLRVFTKQRSLNADFLSHVFANPASVSWFKFHAIGATMPNLNEGIIRSFPLTVPPFQEQRAIAQLLSALDDKIELNRRMNATLEAMARAVFKDWFVDFGPTRAKAEGRPPYLAPDLWALFPDALDDDDKPVGWGFKPVGQLVEFNPSESLSKGSEAPYLDMAALPTQGSWPEPPIQRPFASGSKFRDGDTLLARITPCLENGKTAFIQCLGEGVVGWGSTEFIVLRPKQPFPLEYGYLLARDEGFRDRAIQSMTGTSGRQRVQTDSLASYEVTLPDEPVLRAFSNLIQSGFAMIRANATQSQTLAGLRDLLLPKLMSGEIRLRDAEKAVEAVA